MSVSDYFDKIESVAFQAEFAVLSGFRAFRKSLEHTEIIKSLIDAAFAQDGGAMDLYDRIELLLTRIEGGSGAEYDVAIAAYLFCLQSVEPALAQQLSSRVLQKGGLWWTVDLALHIARTTAHDGDQLPLRPSAPILETAPHAVTA